VAKWNGSNWESLGVGTDGWVYSLGVFGNSHGDQLYVGGNYELAGNLVARNIARWDGTHWSTVNGGTQGEVDSLATFDDGSGSALYVGGSFIKVGPDGTVPANAIAKWNGVSWSALGSGLTLGGPVITAYALTVFDDGSGPALYAGGWFTNAGGSSANYIAKWNGAHWSPLGSGLNARVHSMAVFDDGTGPALYAGGAFTTAGGTPARFVAKWSHGVWSAVDQGTGSIVYALSVFDDGAGPALYAGGVFDSAGGEVIRRIAKWNGRKWSDLEGGVRGIVYSLHVGDDGSGPALFVGGDFLHAHGAVTHNMAKWQGCDHAGASICVGDGSGSICPCANFGTPGHGCENSARSGGALLSASGLTSLAFDTLTLSASGETQHASSLFLQGSTQVPPQPFGDGLLCTGGTVRRLYVTSASAGTATAPGHHELHVAARSAELGDPILIGQTRVYQACYRDSEAAYCPAPVGGAWNLTSGLRLAWLP
jgi:hypothetical protein